MMQNHCSGCGTQNPQVEDGYTECCNEYVCDGRGGYRWAYGTMTAPDFRHVKIGELTACCGGGADAKAALKGAGFVALSREH
jgi:hypothetical protein